MKWPRADKLPVVRPRILAVFLAVLPVLAAAACTPSGPPARPPPTASPPTASTQTQPQVAASLARALADTAVLYGIGVSTDPHADGAVAAGIGVATTTPSRQLTSAEVHGSRWGGNARWLRPGQVLVERPARAGPPAGWLRYRYAQGLISGTQALDAFDRRRPGALLSSRRIAGRA